MAGTILSIAPVGPTCARVGTLFAYLKSSEAQRRQALAQCMTGFGPMDSSKSHGEVSAL